MDASPPVCSGGVVEFVAYHADGLNWRRISIHCSLSQLDLILLLCVLSIALIVFAVFSLSDLCIFRRRKFSSPVLSEDEDLHQRMTLMGDIVKPIHRSFLVHVRTYLTSKGTTITTTSVADTSIVLETFRPLKLSLDEKDSADGSPISLSIPSRSCPVNIFCIGLIVSVIVALLVGTIYTCFLAQQIERTLIGLTEHIEDVSRSFKDLVNTFISESYSIMNRVIKEDVAQSNHISNLRPFIEDMKLIWGDEAMRLYAMALNITPTKQWLRENTRSNLLHFNTFLRRLSSLFSVAPFLSEASIKSVNDIYLSYTHELVRLTPHPLFKLDSWKHIQVLNFTSVVLCEHNTSLFPTCADVESYLEMIADKLEAWPSYIKSRDFTKVTAFTLLPRMLNAEAHVERWVPLAQDPTGKVPFLFDQFLIPEIDKDRARLNRSLDNLPKRWADSSARKYISIASAFPVVIAIMLSILLLLSVITVLINSNCCFCCLTRTNRVSRDKAVGKISTCYHQSFAIVATFLCIIGVVCGTVGSIGQNQLCDVLLVRPQSADIWLNHLMTRLLPVVDDLKEVLEIENIQFRIPERVFSTLDSNYTSKSLPLLQSVHMNRPLNLTALWRSHWLNKTLYGLWYKDVWTLMEKANISYRIPRVPLSKTFCRFRTAVKLDQTFDELYVGNVTEYLPEPAEDYYTKIGLALKAISNRGSREVDQLATYFTAIGDLIALYKLKFDQIAQALKVIEENKMILKPLSPLIDVGDKIIGYLANKTDSELIAQFTNNTAEIYINSHSIVERYIIPMVHRILDQLFPYPRLRETYRKTLSPICPTELPYSALFLSLRSFGFTLSLSAFGLFIVSIGCNRILLRAHNSAS
ncbi:unnamed protein product [Hymenolepis diminuta]|uniref:Transmembrane protein n=2 Tax=Hymenolepis diminuta TaxID=6216 RepID=A0A0R3SFQ8_HYMDI|nr:unnamed protein product [Hymenolepis diminuta]